MLRAQTEHCQASWALEQHHILDVTLIYQQKRLPLCYSIVLHCNAMQWYGQFLQIDRRNWALILLGLALYLPNNCVSGLHGALCIYIFVQLLLIPFTELSMVELALDLVD